MAKKKTKQSKKDLPNFFKRLSKVSAITLLAFLLTLLLLIIIPWSQETIAVPVTVTSSAHDLPAVALLPESKGQPLPSFSARNVFIVDKNSKVILFARDADQKVYPASTTKMMTALVALDHFALNQTITVTKEYPIGQRVGFKPGEQINVENLLYALLVQSGNDAAEILAENYPGGRVAFIEAMNRNAADFHLNNTHFANPTGIDEIGHYSTAIDLARLGDVALRNAEFARIVATENAVISSVDASNSRIITNINELLGKVVGVRGIKTGYTEGAGQSLVTLVERDGHAVILVVLGSSDRFGDTKNLIEWVYSNFQWRNPLDSLD